MKEPFFFVQCDVSIGQLTVSRTGKLPILMITLTRTAPEKQRIQLARLYLTRHFADVELA